MIMSYNPDYSATCFMIINGNWSLIERGEYLIVLLHPDFQPALFPRSYKYIQQICNSKHNYAGNLKPTNNVFY